MENPLVSIILPVKDGSVHLAACLDSILSQTYQQWELFIVDDHSTDETALLAQTFVARNPRIHLIPNQGQGIIPALQTGLYHASGTCITRMDHDDIMGPQKIELMVDALVQAGPGHVVVGEVAYFAERPLGKGYEKYTAWLNSLIAANTHWSEIYQECPIPSPCWMVFREDLLRIDDFDHLNYPEDYDLAFRFRSAGIKVIGIPQILHYWRDHPNRTSRNDPIYLDNRFIPLKVRWFIKLDRRRMPLVLWGAGKKGKYIARELNENAIQFDWITNNRQKIGRQIYGVELESDRSRLRKPTPSQVIIAISDRSEQATIHSIRSECTHHQYFAFCQ